MWTEHCQGKSVISTVVLGTEPRALRVLGKHSTPEVHPQLVYTQFFLVLPSLPLILHLFRPGK